MPRRYYLLVTLATLAGAFLRLWQLTAVPPGLHYDLAATALLGNEVAFHGYRPLFITAYTGHEVLFYYWLAGWFNLVGSSVFTLRLAAALLGTLTIPATFFAVREVLHGEDYSHQSAAFAAVLLAFAFFHVTFSRFGFRVIVEPPVQCLALGFLFRGLRGLSRPGTAPWIRAPSTWHLALAGAFTGLAAYTYLSARLFPFPLGVFWAAVLLGIQGVPSTSQATPRRIWFLGFGVFLIAALVVFAPLGLYFLEHPDDFFNRAGQIVARPGEEGLIWQGVRRAAEMLFINGEPYDRFNLPGLPLFSFPLGLFFLIGLLITIWKLWRPGAPTPRQRAIELLLLAWLPAMLLPTALSVHEIFPSNVRAFGLTPLVFVFPARGLLAAYRWVQRRSPGPLLPTAYPVTLVGLVILVTGTSVTYRDYFITWANLRSQRLNNDADLTGIAEYLNGSSAAVRGATPYVSAIHYRHPTLAYLAHDFAVVEWLTGGRSLAIPKEAATLYLLAASAPLPEEWVAGWGPHLVYEQLGPDNRPEFQAYRFEAGEPPPLPEFIPTEANFSNAIFLSGYRLMPEAENLTVDLRWRIENPIDTDDVLPYARLYDAAGRAWAQSVDFTYPSEQWLPGDTLITRLIVPLPAGLPPGEYTVRTGLYSESTGISLTRLNAQGGFGGERAVVGVIRLAGDPPATPDEFRAANVITPPLRVEGFAGDLQLLGYQLHSTSLRQNERFELELFWNARRPAAAPVQVRLGDQSLSNDQLTVQNVRISRYTLRVPDASRPGPAELEVVVPGVGEAALTSIVVVPVERRLTRPEVSVRLEADFGPGGFTLVGYSLQPGPTTTLTLVWQAGAALPDTDYTVFVHVQDASGQIVAQADHAPRRGAYPTSMWVSGEYVTDEYEFNLAPGEYSLAVGLYEAESGERLPVSAGGQPQGDQVRVPEFSVP